jgi:hypothetical protein
MSHKLPRTLQAVPTTLHAQLEIADAIRKLSTADREDCARQRREELGALRRDLGKLREDLGKISRDFPMLFLTELRKVGFNPNEPRVPAGSGSKSGEWTHEPGGDEQAANPQLAQLGPPPVLLDEPPVIVRPPLPEFPQSATKPPGPGWEWRGAPGANPGDPNGSWYNPETGESLHPDMQHDPPLGPHWDYRAPDNTWYRWFPDGRLEIRA